MSSRAPRSSSDIAAECVARRWSSIRAAPTIVLSRKHSDVSSFLSRTSACVMRQSSVLKYETDASHWREGSCSPRAVARTVSMFWTVLAPEALEPATDAASPPCSWVGEASLTVEPAAAPRRAWSARPCSRSCARKSSRSAFAEEEPASTAFWAAACLVVSCATSSSKVRCCCAACSASFA